jgi:protein TonB
MKYLLFVVFLITSNTYSQEINDKVFSFSEVDEKPDFPGGIGKFYKFTAKNFIIPPEERLDGKVIVEFVIEKDGSITNINVKEDIGYGTAQETIRLLGKCPKWMPGKKNGEVVRTLFRLPITIKTE